MGGRRVRLATLAIAGSLLGSIISTGNPARATVICADAGMQGCWSRPFSPFGKYDAAPPATVQQSLEFPAAASAVVLPSGQILYWNGLQNLEGCGGVALPTDAGRCAGNSTSELLDLTGTSTQFFPVGTNPGDDMFCADQRLLADGRVMVAGGTHWESEIDSQETVPQSPTPGLAELYGSTHTRLYGGTWTQNDAGNMHEGRWYPSLVTQGNGTEFVAGGVSKLLWNSSALDPRASQPYPQNVKETETFDPATSTWTDNGRSADVALPLFARLHLLPDGEIFYDGAGQMWGPAGESADQLDWNFQRSYDPVAKSWRQSGIGSFGARSGAFSVMLPLRPDASGAYDQAQFLMGGGVLGTSPGGELATNFSELITVKPDAGGEWMSSSARTPDMVNRRWYSSAVLLPNGNVLAFSGADKDEVVVPGTEVPVRQAELWNGTTWVGLGSAGRDRTYHNSALLLPDGSVLIGGHAPINQGYGATGAENNQANGLANNLKDPSFERFYPPYLFHGTRPVLESAQAGATYGDDLVATLAPDSTEVTKVELVRLPSVTHITDADQRTVEVPFDQNGTSLHVHVPANTSVLPPGYYYLFALSADGTPAVAPIVRIAPDGGPAGTVLPVHLADSTLR